MMSIATSQYRNARRPCRSPIGYGAARSDTQHAPLSNTRLPINAPPFDRNDLLSHHIGLDQRARLTSSNSHTVSAALKSP
jgi:hypothetical protein